jgi:hypothetical protein
MAFEKVYTDLIPKGISMEYNGKIFIGTNEELKKKLVKRKDKESA